MGFLTLGGLLKTPFDSGRGLSRWFVGAITDLLERPWDRKRGFFNSPPASRIPLAAGVLALVLAGCSSGDSGNSIAGPPPAPERTTRMGAVNLLAHAVAGQDLETYEECLHPTYRFWFLEDLTGEGSWDWVIWITKAQDMDITRNMFEAERVTDVELQLYNVTDVDGAESDEDRFVERRFLSGSDTLVAYQADVLVNMHVIEDAGDEIVDHWVHGGAEVYVRPDPEDGDLWTVWWIQDLSDHRAKVGTTSWTALKVMFGS